MSWGSGPWGSGSPWGAGSAGAPPTLIEASPSVVDVEGGDVITVLGTNFEAPMQVDFMIGVDVIGPGYIFDARFDVARNRALVGTPILPPGVYSIRVTTPSGTTTLTDAVEAKIHAQELRVVGNRSKWAAPWDVGDRYLR